MSQEIYEKFRNAIVSIYSEAQYGPDPALDTIFFSGGGFFIKGHYIITAAQIVLMNPQESFRYVPANGVMTRMQRIWVQVYNVNNSCKSYAYEATLIGVDGAGDSALLKIDPNKPWNQNLPRIKDQPYFKWGNNRKYLPGNSVTSINSSISSFDYQSISQGNVRNNRFMERNGDIVYEEVFTTLPLTNDSIFPFGGNGSPILDACGRVVGLLNNTLSLSGEEVSGGPSEHFVKRVIKQLIAADKGQLSPHVQLITDPFGNFYSYVKGYLGFQWKVVITLDFISFLAPDGCTSEFILTPQGPGTKEIIGMLIIYVDGAGGCSPSTGTNSPFLGTIVPGDIVTHINGKAIGNIPCQIIPTLVTWKLLPGDNVTLKYRKGTEFFVTEYETTAPLASFPK